MKINLDESAYSSKFLSLLETTAEYVIAFGGRGGGKTHHIILKLILASFSNDYQKIIYVNKVFRNIKNAQFATLKRVIEELGLKAYFKFYEGDYRIVNKVTGNWFIPFGMDDSESTKALDNPTIMWWDEITQGSMDDFLALNNLLRTPGANPQFIVSFNPVNEKHWVRTFFFSDNDAYKGNVELLKDVFVHHSTFEDNEFIDQQKYLNKLNLQIVKGEANLECDRFGRWGNVKKQNLFIFNFDQKKHTCQDVTLVDNEYIEISIDFNVEPMTAIVAQRDYYNRWIRYVQEYRIGPSDIYELCERIKEDHDTTRIIVTGDSSGWARSYMNRGHKKGYEIIKEELNLEDWQIKTPKGKPANYIQDKRRLANYILGLHPDIKFGNMPFLFNDFDSVQCNAKGEMNKNKDPQKAHLIDCFCDHLYTFCKEWEHETAKQTDIKE